MSNVIQLVSCRLKKSNKKDILRVENPKETTIVYPNGNVVKTKKSQSKTKQNEQTNN